MGGQAGARGYLVQTITCLLQALRDNTWLTLELEPNKEIEQVDIRWTYANGRKKVIQIKSSQNQIGSKDVEKWAAELEQTQADDYELQLLGPCSQPVIDRPLVGKVRVPTPYPLDLEILLQAAAHCLDEYLQSIDVSGIAPAQRKLLVEALTTDLNKGSVSGTPRNKHELDQWLRERIQLLVAEIGSPVLFEGVGAVPALKVPHFIGRDEELNALRSALASNTEAVCVVVAGLGGTGKTALVQQFVATEAQAFFPEGVAWLDGTELIREVARVAIRFGLRIGQSTPPEEISRQLCQELHRRRILLVIDNVDRERSPLQSLPIPGGLCRTVLTTRTATLHADLGKHSESLRLGSWNKETCCSYFRRVVPSLQKSIDTQLEALSSFVGGLPLAVRLLAKLLMKPGNTPERLLARLKQAPVSTLDLAAQGADRGIVATFLVALKELTPDQLRVLIATAACARSTRDFVVWSVAGLGESDVIAALSELADRSLVDFTEGSDRPWSMHDIVRLLVRLHPDFHQAALPRHGLYILEKAHTFATRIRQRVTGELPRQEELSNVDDEHDIPEFLAAIDNHIDTGIGQFALMMLKPAGEFLFGRIHYASIKYRIQETLQLFSPGSPDTAGLLCWLGQCCFQLGELQDAIKNLNLAVDIAKRHSLPEEESNAHGHLGYCFRLLGDVSRGISHLEQTLRISERTGNLGAQSVALTGIANCYRTLHDLPKAMELLGRSLAIAQRIDEPKAEADAWLHLGHCYLEKREVRKAIDAYERVLQTSEDLDITARPAALAGLAACHGEIGDILKAKDFSERALEINQRLGRIEGQAVALLNRSKIFGSTNNHRQQVEDLERSLAMCEKSGSLEGQANALSRLSEVWSELGHIEDAIRYEERALAVREKLGFTELQCRSLITLGRYHLECGDDEVGLEYHRRALSHSAKYQLKEWQAAAFMEIAEYFFSVNELPSAASNFERALVIFEEMEDAERQSHALRSLAACAFEMDDCSRAVVCLVRLLPIAELEGDAAEVLADIGVAKQRLGELPDAVEHLRRSLALLSGEYHDKKLDVSLHLIQCLYEMRQFADALSFLVEALVLSERLGNGERQVMCLEAMGGCYWELGDIGQAQAVYLRLLSFGENAALPGSQVGTLLQLARCGLQLGEHSQAMMYAERALVLVQKHGDFAGQASAYNLIGACHLAVNNLNAALESLSRALELDEMQGSGVQKPHILANIGLCHRGLGAISEAIKYIERAVAIFHQSGEVVSKQHLLTVLEELRKQA
jgi:tetratricopeptide (TPR) repeat protein